MRVLDPANPGTLTASFRSWYNRMHNEMTCAFPGMTQLIRDLKRQGVRLGIVTNNSREGTRMGLEHLGLTGAFSVVVTCDDVSCCKPDPEGIRLALDRLGSDPAGALFVGDSANDLLAARRAGIPGVLVGWTSLDPAKLLDCRPTYIVHRAEQLSELVGTGQRISA